MELTNKTLSDETTMDVIEAKVRSVIRSARARERHRKIIGGVVGLVAASVKTDKLRVLVPNAVQQEPSDLVPQFAYCDVQAIPMRSLLAFTHSVADNLRQQTNISLCLDPRDPVPEQTFGFLLEQFQDQNQNSEIFLFLDEFHHMLELENEIERTDVMRFLKHLSTIHRVHIFISSTCMPLVLHYCKVLPPSGFSLAQNCRLVTLPVDACV